jgi:hypothetical protein
VAARAVAGDEQPRAYDSERDLPDDQPERAAGRGRRVDAPVRHHFSPTWLDRGGSEGDLMELNGWSSPQMLRRYGARARRTYDRVMEGKP